jgi:hypothetical protein
MGFSAHSVMGYIFAAGSLLGWPQRVGATLVVLWFASLGAIAYWRHRRKVAPLPRGQEKGAAHSLPLLRALLLLGLLISLIGSALEAEASLRGLADLRSHPVRSIVYPSGVLIGILMAGQQRRTIIVIALRIFLGLLVIGGVTRPGLAGFSVAALAGGALFVLVRYVSTSPPLNQNLHAPTDTFVGS